MKRIYYINSRDRISGTDSDFTFDIDMKGINATHAVILAAYIPKSYYSISSPANSFTLEEDGKQATVTLQPGSYNRQALITSLQTALNSTSLNGWSYSVAAASTSSAETGKLTYTVSGNTSQPVFIFPVSSPWEQLGFDRSSINTFVGDGIESTNVVNLQGEHTLFLHSDLVQESDNVLQEFYTSNELSFSSLSFQNPNPELYAKKLQSKTDNVYRFYLTDEDSNPINLNGLNIVLTLLVYRPLDLRMALSEIIRRLE